MYLTRIGANDPDFNLRRDAAITLRRNDTQDTLFVSVVELHGSYSPVSESSINSRSSVKSLEVVLDSDAYTGVRITDVKGDTQLFIIATSNNDSGARHQVSLGDESYSWIGPYFYM